MKLLVLVLVLGVRRLEVNWPHGLIHPGRHRAWLQGLASRFGNGALLYSLAIVLPAVLLLLLGKGLAGFWAQWLWLLIAFVVLLWLMGGQSEFRQVDELLVRGRMNDPDGFAALAEDAFGVAGDPASEVFQQRLATQVVAREFTVFAVIFWWMVLGLPGAFVMVMNRIWLERTGATETWLSWLHRGMCWPAHRLLVLSMALAGDFAAVMKHMQQRWLTVEQNSDDYAVSLLAASAAAAEHPAATDESSLLDCLQPLEERHGLMLRCLAICLIACALGVLLF